MTYERFEQLPVWQAAIDLASAVYALTETPPFHGRYSLRDQIERAADIVADGGASVIRGGAFGRWAGIIIAAVSIFAQMFWVPIVPFWAFTVMLLDALVIYGLAVYGGQRKAVEVATPQTERERDIRAA